MTFNNELLLSLIPLFKQLRVIAIIIFICLLIFEIIIPLVAGEKNKIRSNIRDLVIYTIGLSFFSYILGFFFMKMITTYNIPVGFISMQDKPLLLQIIILCLFLDLASYLLHMSVHKFKIPILTKAHMFHHSVTKDMDWVNARKEHILIIALFTLFSVLLLQVMFKSDNIANFIVINLFLFLDLLSHYRKPITIKYIDQVFLFPKDHIRHHTIRKSGPYGVHSTIFDTIFNTRD